MPKFLLLKFKQVPLPLIFFNFGQPHPWRHITEPPKKRNFREIVSSKAENRNEHNRLNF